MKISELPTPRLRARAMEWCEQSAGTHQDWGVDQGFYWGTTDEGYDFWSTCCEGDWDKAKELQPDLFKPMDGKPHIKIHRVSGLIVVNYPVLVMTPNLKLVYKYIQEVSPREDYTTIQEAVDALYSFKRSTCCEGDWDKAKELQPDLFKPMDGKPHIKLWSCLPNECTLIVDNYGDGYDSGDLSAYDKAIEYCIEVTPGYYPTIQEAVDALYSYRRN